MTRPRFLRARISEYVLYHLSSTTQAHGIIAVGQMLYALEFSLLSSMQLRIRLSRASDLASSLQYRSMPCQPVLTLLGDTIRHLNHANDPPAITSAQAYGSPGMEDAI